MFYLNTAYQNLFAQYGIDSKETLYNFCHAGQRLYRGSVSTVWKCHMGDFGIYAKRYRYSTPRWRYIGGLSRGRNELRSYSYFRQLGIPCPDVLAFAEKRKWGRFNWCLIVTREISHAKDLFFIYKNRELDASLRMSIMQQLGRYVALLHRNKFYHHDLKLRNILRGGDGELYFIDCPRGSKKIWHSRRAAEYDMKTLYQHAAEVCSPSEWQNFLEAYAGKS